MTASTALTSFEQHRPRTLWQLMRKGSTEVEERLAHLGSEPAMLTYRDGMLFAVTMVAVDSGRVQCVFKLLNPDKLRATAARFPFAAG